MHREPRSSEKEPGVGADGPRQLDPDEEGEMRPPARVIPGNVGSLNDVPPEWVEDGVSTVADEEM